MKDITIIIPVHNFNEEVKNLLENALNSIKKNQENYTYGKLIPLIVAPANILEEIGENDYYHNCRNTSGNIDFCSQVNFGVEHIETDYFSILEYDD